MIFWDRDIVIIREIENLEVSFEMQEQTDLIELCTIHCANLFFVDTVERTDPSNMLRCNQSGHHEDSLRSFSCRGH